MCNSGRKYGWVEGDAASLTGVNKHFEKLIVATKMLFIFAREKTAVTITHVF